MKEINWLNAVEGGYIKLERAFVAITNRPPSVYRFNIIDKIDLAQCYSVLKQHFPTDIITISNNYSPLIEELEIEYDDYDEAINSITIYSDNQIYHFDEREIMVYSADEFDIEKFGKEMVNILPKKEKERLPTVELIAYSQGFYTITSKIKGTNVDIDLNYNDDFKPVYEDIKRFINERESGLAILHGEKGSGKTQLIRHLITNFPAKYVLVTQTIADQITNPEFTTFLLENKNSIFIVEDCEQILIKREDALRSSSGIATILNMADGLLSDVFNIKFIFTFNADIDSIDEALLRKGRCFANYEFNKLSEEKVKKLNEKLNLGLDEIKPMTLAEIYYKDCSEYTTEDKKKPKIGF